MFLDAVHAAWHVNRICSEEHCYFSSPLSADLPPTPHPIIIAAGTAATTAGVQKGRCDIELEGDSVDDVMRLLNKICDEMNGAIGPQHHIHKESIRYGNFALFPSCFRCVSGLGSSLFSGCEFWSSELNSSVHPMTWLCCSIIVFMASPTTGLSIWHLRIYTVTSGPGQLSYSRSTSLLGRLLARSCMVMQKFWNDG